MNEKATEKLLRAIVNVRNSLEELEETLRDIVKTDRDLVAKNSTHLSVSSTAITKEKAESYWQELKLHSSEEDFQDVFQRLIGPLTSDSLRLFMRYNRLPIDSKVKKEEAIRQILQVLRAEAAIQGKLIRGRQDSDNQDQPETREHS